MGLSRPGVGAVPPGVYLLVTLYQGHVIHMTLTCLIWRRTLEAQLGYGFYRDDVAVSATFSGVVISSILRRSSSDNGILLFS